MRRKEKNASGGILAFYFTNGNLTNNLPSLQSLMPLFIILPVFPLKHLTFQLSKRENEKSSVSQHPAQDNPIEQTSQPRSPCRLFRLPSSNQAQILVQKSVVKVANLGLGAHVLSSSQWLGSRVMWNIARRPKCRKRL